MAEFLQICCKKLLQYNKICICWSIYFILHVLRMTYLTITLSVTVANAAAADAAVLFVLVILLQCIVVVSC